MVNHIKSIVVSEDSSMVNPMNPVTSSNLTLSSDLTLTLGEGRKRSITKSQFNNAIREIKFIDISKLKEIKHPPSLGDSYKSLSIKTDKGTHFFSSSNDRDYPSVIADLSANIYKLWRSPAQSSGAEN